MGWLYVYLIGLVIAVVVFYNGGVRGKARNPELWSLVYGVVWPISLPVLIYFVWKAFQDDKGSAGRTR